jgi:multiple sugar transport system ATP-binding protein
VFQNYALYPHMTVAENLAFGLRLRRIPKAERARRALEVARKLALEELLDRKPSELSGGQRQRVAMGRAMVREPKAFLMDEPLSNLDAKLRVTMRAELARLHERLGVTTVYVTHDQVEAMTLGHRVAVLRDGVLQQVDTPQRLFREPANLFVASFIGSPSMNLVEAELVDGRLRFGDHALPLADTVRLPQRRVILGIRPTDFEDGTVSDPTLPRLRIRPEVVEDLGAETHVIFPVDAPRVVSDAVRGAQALPEPGEGLIADDTRALFTACIDGERPVAPGSELELAVDPTRFHFFHPDTGAVLGRAVAVAGA